ncbi:MAG TPA: MgtC/SapB family protein [bacterium]|jgi:putative Mg2+ transporter-C (MgtC) family protein|nr:MgtC/SapB family protein [bacterium]
MIFACDILLATLLGSLIGLERQWRQRFAGLRTNALVATGAAAFASAAVSPLCLVNPGTVIGSVVTGIGFLGAGVIFKEDFSVSGLNTAATLWCSAAVGVLAGMGLRAESIVLAAVVIGINVVLRPIARRLAQGAADASSEMESTYRIYGLCARRMEQAVRTVLVEEASNARFRVRDLHSEPAPGGLARISVDLVLVGRDDRRIEEVINRISVKPGVRSMHWQLERSASHFE